MNTGNADHVRQMDDLVARLRRYPPLGPDEYERVQEELRRVVGRWLKQRHKDGEA